MLAVDKNCLQGGFQQSVISNGSVVSQNNNHSFVGLSGSKSVQVFFYRFFISVLRRSNQHWNDFLYKSEIQDGHHCRTLFIGPYVNINEIIF
jgi:hypothetical protein